MNKEYFEAHGILLHPSKQWEYDLYQFWPHSMGDCVTNMMCKSIEDQTTEYVPICYELLKANKRWPDSLQELHKDRICKNRIERAWEGFWWQNYETEKRPIRTTWSKVTRFFGLKKTFIKYRSQGSESRDPYTWFFASIILNGLDPKQWIEPIKASFFVRRRGLSMWRMYLITKDPKYKRRYERATLRTLWMPRRVYAFELTEIRAKAAGSEKILEAIKKYKQLPNKG